MSLTIRNQLPGTVTAVQPGEAMAVVRARLTGDQEITAAVTADSAAFNRLLPVKAST